LFSRRLAFVLQGERWILAMDMFGLNVVTLDLSDPEVNDEGIAVSTLTCI